VDGAWIGIDTGGTFTDLTLAIVPNGGYWFHKVPTTPDDASIGILKGIDELLDLAKVEAGRVAFICHGTTLATNAILEGKWARTGLITTGGFRDILDLARQRRPNFFNLDIAKPTPPALRADRHEVPERMAADGEVITPLDKDAVKDAVSKLRQAGCDAVAICFLHSYANHEHERQAADIVREIWPEAYLSTSADVLSEFREYERFATTVVNASLLPVIDHYLDRFEKGVEQLGIGAAPRIMQSNGGAVSPVSVRAKQVNTFFSGPAGGIIGAAQLGVEAGCPDIITLDMGGTSTDVALIRHGVPGKKDAREMGGFPVRTRTLDIHTIGAGGGSLAWIDPGGLLKVGPRSAGSKPGPASYGRGGTLPTATDANMVLGRLNQKALLGGRMPVYPELGRKAIEEHLCGKLAMSLERAAAGVLEIINVNMMGAVRVISVEQGEDPRRFALMPFGGAGPLHVCDIARIMDIQDVFVPQRPGILSSLGLLHADTQGDFSLTRLVSAGEESLGKLNEAISQLKERGRAWLNMERLEAADAIYGWAVDLRYLGQNFELSAALKSDHIDPAELRRLIEGFHVAHEQAYGYRMTDRPVEVVNVRLNVNVPRPVPPSLSASGGGSLSAARIETRPVWFHDTGFVETPVYDRAGIPLEAEFSGPAIVEQMDATTVIPSGAKVKNDRFGNLMIRIPSTTGAGEKE
jgi:N-methylhydantoinase A